MGRIAAPSGGGGLDAIGVIDLVEEYGADPTGVTAIDTILDIALARLNKHSTVWTGQPWRLFLRPGKFKVALPHLWTAPIGCELVGSGPWSTKVVWAGGPTGHMLTMRNPRSMKVKGIDFSTGGLMTSAVNNDTSLLRMNRAVGLDIYNPTGVLVEDCIFRDGIVGGDYVVIDGDPFQNDYHRFNRIVTEGVVGQRSTVRIDSQQQKGTIFDQCVMGVGQSAIYCPNQNGSMEWRGGFLFNHSLADFNLDSVIDPFTVTGNWRSEGSARLIYNPGDSGNHWLLNVDKGIFSTNGLHADGFWCVIGKTGPLYFGAGLGIGGSGFPSAQIRILATAPSRLDIVGVSFDALNSVNLDPVSLVAGHQCIVTRRDNMYRTAGNLVVQREDEVGDNKAIRTSAISTAIRAGDSMVLMDASLGALTATLPSPVGHTRVYTIKKVDGSANVVTIDGNGFLIDGAATIPLDTQYQGYTLQSDGSAWHIQ